MNNIRKAFVKAIDEMELVDDDRVEYENENFEHPEKGTWIRVIFVPNNPVVAELGNKGTDMVTGFFQVDLNDQIGEGDGNLTALFDKLRRRFTAGTELVYDCTTTVITSTGRSSGRLVDGFYRITATIAFYSRLIRTQNN